MSEIETWKDIIGLEGLYQVSDLGRVKSLGRKDFAGRNRKEKFLRPGIDSSGYLSVVLLNLKIQKTKRIHKLVAITFLDHEPCKYEKVINHKNFIKTDNRLENLEIVTHRENTNLKHIKSSSKYTGVTWDKRRMRWAAQIQINKKNKYLGHFKNEDDAHLAYQKALKEII